MCKYSILENTIKWISRKSKFNISIHDISGILHNNPLLQLSSENKVHDAPYCNTVKLTPKGMKMCLKCKSLSIKKALLCKETYVGQCYYGVTEIVKPVFLNDKPLCIIYLGNLLLQEQYNEILDRILKISKFSGVKAELLNNAINTLDLVNRKQVEEYKEITDIISHQILLSANEAKRAKVKGSLSPAYRSSKNWVIESIQNHIMIYFDRELKLSQFADMYFLNPQYLCRLFKKETGTNFSDYVNLIRIEKAKKLLELTKEPILNIAMQVGFNHVSYFNRIFKQLVGVCPSEYRQKV
jgi:YesN/AraC family two-component response regulator